MCRNVQSFSEASKPLFPGHSTFSSSLSNLVSYLCILLYVYIKIGHLRRHSLTSPYLYTHPVLAHLKIKSIFTCFVFPPFLVLCHSFFCTVFLMIHFLFFPPLGLLHYLFLTFYVFNIFQNNVFLFSPFLST